MPITRFTLKVFTTKGRECEPFIFRAPSGCHYTDEGIQVTISQFMAEMEKHFPGVIFRVVKTGRAQWNALPDVSANA